MKTAILFLVLACPAFAGQPVPVQLPGDRLKEALDFFNAHQRDMDAALKWFAANKDDITQLIQNVNQILVVLGNAAGELPVVRRPVQAGMLDDAGAAIRQVSRAAFAAETCLWMVCGLVGVTVTLTLIDRLRKRA